MMRPRRYTAHQHAGTGRWYVFDQLESRPCVLCLPTEVEGWARARLLEAMWASACRRHRRGEFATTAP